MFLLHISLAIKTSHGSIVMKHTKVYCSIFVGAMGLIFLLLINRTIHVCLEI